MHVTINAIPIRPGGGLTVVCGLVDSLHAARPDWRLTVLAGDPAARQAVIDAGGATDVHLVAPRGGSAGTFLWQNVRLGASLIRLRADALLTFNHFLSGVPTDCSQIVYHLNLRRFCTAFRGRRLRATLAEGVRDWAARRALEHASANVFESHFLREAAENHSGRPPHNAHVAYIGLPDALLALARQPAPAPQSSRRLVTITSPEVHKDNPTLIRMMAELVRRAPGKDWRLDLVGGIRPELWQSSQQLADQLGVRDRITWHGFLAQPAITDLLRGALCLPATSQLESFAMVALEAMARGCPPIVADCSAMPESVGDAALLVKPGDPCAFAGAVLRLAADAPLRAGLVDRGRKWVQGFSWATCGQTFARLIETLHAARRTPAVQSRRQTAAPAA